MFQRTLLALSTLAALWLAPARVGLAQQRTPHYITTPRISPYIHLFRSDTGGLGSYYAFVRPRLDRLKFEQRQAARNQVFQQQLAYQQQLLLTQRDSPRSLQLRPTRSNAVPRSESASFMDYSHFYPQSAAARRR